MRGAPAHRCMVTRASVRTRPIYLSYIWSLPSMKGLDDDFPALSTLSLPVDRKPQVRRLPRHGAGEEFLKGPVSWAWLQAASSCPGRALAVALAVWFQAGLKKRNGVALSLSSLGAMGSSATRHAGGWRRWSARGWWPSIGRLGAPPSSPSSKGEGSMAQVTGGCGSPAVWHRLAKGVAPLANRQAEAPAPAGGACQRGDDTHSPGSPSRLGPRWRRSRSPTPRRRRRSPEWKLSFIARGG